MKDNDLYWIDKNGNRWSKSSYTEDQAIILSKSLNDHGYIKYAETAEMLIRKEF